MEPLSKTEVIEIRKKHLGSSCALFFKADPLKIVRGSGCRLYDENGRDYLDCINNVCHVGHCHPRVVKALSSQAAVLNTNSRYLHDNLALYIKKLVSTFPAPLCKVYMVNSGSEANDLALRMAMAHTKSSEIITLDHAYHGHVTSAFGISPYKLRQLHGDAKPSHVHVAPCPDTYNGVFKDWDHADRDMGKLYADQVQEIIQRLAADGSRPAAFIAESLQSCGGQIIPPKGYLSRVYQHVRAAGGVCIADEVQVGFGRVGSHMWAFQIQDDVTPDIVTVGKPMGNGHPVAAVICTEEVDRSFATLGCEYFNTYGGNPVSCAVALAVLQIIEDERLLEHCVRMEKLLRAELQKLMDKHTIIGDICLKGLFFGLDLVKDRETRQPASEEAQQVLNLLIKERVLMSTDGPNRNVIKFKPPIVFSEADCMQMVEKLDLTLSRLKTQLVNSAVVQNGAS